MGARKVLWAIILVGSMSFFSGFSNPVEDMNALVDFITEIPHRSGVLNWYAYTSVCDQWMGVICNSDRSRIVAIHLPSIGLHGNIPPNTISRLSSLQTLDLHSNNLTGAFPSDFTRLSSLRSIQLQFNSFSGPLPSDFSVWTNLTTVNLSFNSFNGSIPSSVSNLTQLASLNLSNNVLSGKIPDLGLPSLKVLDLSNNHLEGVVPSSLLKFPDASFSGNHLFQRSPPPGPSPSFPPLLRNPASSGKKLRESIVLSIIVGVCVVGFVALAVFLAVCCMRRKNKYAVSGKGAKGLSEKAVAVNQEESNKLVFFEGCTFTFDLEDLLRASAEVLGKGTCGMAYKAILEDSTTVVVKRIKDVGMGRRDFEQHMGLVGKIRHENLVELRAYYYSKDEKLMVYDYYSLGSVFSLLHGKTGEDKTPLDWESRLRIALGAARGIEHIHSESGGKLAHGNIKSSNIFLNNQFYGCVSDLGITSLMNQMAVPVSRTVGYRAPEVVELRKSTQMSDVYSFGVVLLELLTGRSPIQVTGGGEDVIHLVRWVQSVVREEWTAEVFDVELMRYPDIEEEMVEMLQIAMSCVEGVPERRPKISEVVRMIADVRTLTGNWPSSETRSEESNDLAPPTEEGGSSQTIEPSPLDN